MGRPDGEVETQDYEIQHEATCDQESFTNQSHNYYNMEQNQQEQQAASNQPGQPAQYPPPAQPNYPIYQNQPTQPPAYPPPQIPQQSTNRPAQYPPQNIKQHPVQYAPQNVQQNPVQYPPQNIQQNPVQYPPQNIQQNRVQYPPQNLQQQVSPMYKSGLNQPTPSAYPPSQNTQQQQVPVQFPPANSQQQPVQFPPHRPQPQANNPMFQNGPSQQASYPPEQGGYNQGPQPVPFPPKDNSVNNGFQTTGGYGGVPASFTKQQYVQGGGVAQGMPVTNPVPQSLPVGYGNNNIEGWRTGLFDCMDDPMNAVITLFFPCLTFGQIAEIVDNGTTSCGTSGLLYGLIAAVIYSPCIFSCTYRTKLRNKFGLPESPAPDWITHFLCEQCALCQEYRELQLRGLDPTIGWQGNVARNPSLQQPQVVMVPPMNQQMMG